VGYRNQITPDLSADATAFFNDYDHLQTFTQLPFLLVNNGIDPLHIFIPVQFRNNMTGKAHGFEVAASWAATTDLKISAHYSFLRLSVDALNPTQEGAEDLYPNQMAGIHASWNINEAWTLDTMATYMDELPGAGIGAYTRLDMNLGWKIRDGLRFNLVGQNLLDDAHREFGLPTDLNTGEIQRSVFGKLTWEF
jgi:iron complex outermembrane receptor protein